MSSWHSYGPKKWSRISATSPVLMSVKRNRIDAEGAGDVVA
jgi:hypothetical protein